MRIKWEDGAEIAVRIEDGACVISANREGLLSLADQFRELADQSPGSHLHLDEWNGLEEGSSELIAEKVPSRK